MSSHHILLAPFIAISVLRLWSLL